jgi:triacylglycerol esterase/lipase EstA (alpha/beta hydrolase family)
MDISGARRVNLIGHSQGGLDGRVLISGLGWGDRVASYTTIAGPHLGTPIADLAAGITTDSEITQALLDGIGDLFGRLLGRGDQAINDSIREMTSEYMIEIFNPAYPNDPQVEYFSWNGHTCSRLEPDCRRDWNGEVVDLLLAPTYRALQIMGYEDSDGLVPLESSKIGTFLGEIPADHLDEVGQLADVRNRSFDHREFFVSEGHRLFDAGF